MLSEPLFLSTILVNGNSSSLSIKGRFARICIELDRKALVPKGDHVQTVEYEGFNLICFHCVLATERIHLPHCFKVDVAPSQDNVQHSAADASSPVSSA